MALVGFRPRVGLLARLVRLDLLARLRLSVPFLPLVHHHCRLVRLARIQVTPGSMVMGSSGFGMARSGSRPIVVLQDHSGRLVRLVLLVPLTSSVRFLVRVRRRCRLILTTLCIRLLLILVTPGSMVMGSSGFGMV